MIECILKSNIIVSLCDRLSDYDNRDIGEKILGSISQLINKVAI
jgi:hypothetical protein